MTALDSNLSWKKQVEYIVKKIKRNIGILCKFRHFVNKEILVSLYYALSYPFLTYGILSWGCTYETNLKPIFILLKKAVRIITFSAYDDSSSPLFKELSIIKLFDLVNLHIVIFMFKFRNNLLPTAFSLFLKKIQQVHKYNTRLSAKQSYYIPKARTNYGIFNIRFQGPKVWNDIDEQLKASPLQLFKKKLKS